MAGQELVQALLGQEYSMLAVGPVVLILQPVD
jgi:hypothetical protein